MLPLFGQTLFKDVPKAPKKQECRYLTNVPIDSAGWCVGGIGGYVERESVGLLFEPENSVDLCESLLRLKNDSGFYKRLKVNCLAGAAKFERKMLAGKMLRILMKCSGR